MSASQEALGAEPGTFLLSQISNEMVRIYKEQFGRGATRARTHWCGPDALTVLLEDTLTAAERNLAAMTSTDGCATRARSFNTRARTSSASRSSG